jgi:hypothetical protein
MLDWRKTLPDEPVASFSVVSGLRMAGRGTDFFKAIYQAGHRRNAETTCCGR